MIKDKLTEFIELIEELNPDTWKSGISEAKKVFKNAEHIYASVTDEDNIDEYVMEDFYETGMNYLHNIIYNYAEDIAYELENEDAEYLISYIKIFNESMEKSERKIKINWFNIAKHMLEHSELYDLSFNLRQKIRNFL